MLTSLLDNGIQRIKGTKDFVYITGQRGTLKLVMHGYSFVRNKDTKDASYYRCSKWKMNKCPAKFTVITSKIDEIVYKSIEHNHPPDCDDLMD